MVRVRWGSCAYSGCKISVVVQCAVVHFDVFVAKCCAVPDSLGDEEVACICVYYTFTVQHDMQGFETVYFNVPLIFHFCCSPARYPVLGLCFHAAAVRASQRTWLTSCTPPRRPNLQLGLRALEGGKVSSFSVFIEAACLMTIEHSI